MKGPTSVADEQSSTAAEVRNRSLPDPREWVDRYADALFGYALVRVGDQDVAKDLVQEVFLAAVQAKDSYSGRSSPKTWLTGILKHKIADHFRRLAREGTEPVADPEESLFGSDGRWRVMPSEWQSDPAAALGRREFWDALGHCLSKLPPRQAAAFSLRELEGQDTDELCKVLETTATNVWVLLHRARMGLRQCLEHGGFGLGEEEST